MTIQNLSEFRLDQSVLVTMQKNSVALIVQVLSAVCLRGELWFLILTCGSRSLLTIRCGKSSGCLACLARCLQALQCVES